MHKIKEIPSDNWQNTFVKEIMIPLSDTQKVEPDAPLWNALLKMDKNGVNQLPVMEGNELLGVLSRESIITFLSLQGYLRNKTAV